MYCVGSVLVGGCEIPASAGSFPGCETRSLFSKSLVWFQRLQPPFRFVVNILEDKTGGCQMMMFNFWKKFQEAWRGASVRWRAGA